MGLRAAGKSTVGRALAERTGVPVVDLDDRTLRALGFPTIADAWRSAGEPAFRAAESAALAIVLAEPPCVVSLGGGTPMAPGADALLRDAVNAGRAVVVYLHAPPAVLRARLREGDPARPSLTGTGMLDEIDAVYAQRDPIYRALAAHIVDASMPTGTQVDDLARIWNVHAASE